MRRGHRVLVTGAAGPLAARVLDALAGDPRVARAEGAEAALPAARLARLLGDGGVDTVVHLGLSRSQGDPASGGGQAGSALREADHASTVHLLAACRPHAPLTRLVLASSGAVYGAGPGAPAQFAEEDDGASPPLSGWARDCADAEAAVRSFARRRPAVRTVTLRLAPLVAPGWPSRLVRLLSLPAVPVPAGHDGRLQVVHPDDAVAATLAAALGGNGAGPRGEVNVASPGVVTVSQAAALAGRPVVPLPPALLHHPATLPGLSGAPALDDDDLAVLAHGRVLDVTRLRRDLGVTPSRTTREVVAEAVAGLRAEGSLTALHARLRAARTAGGRS